MLFIYDDDLFNDDCDYERDNPGGDGSYYENGEEEDDELVLVLLLILK